MRTNAPCVLVASTSWWAFPARVAMAFANQGWRVEAVCWHGHPLSKTTAVRRIHHYGSLRPLDALQAAMARAEPGLIVPCDDRAVDHLHALHGRAQAQGRSAIADLIERSLGCPESYPLARARSDFIAAARAVGVLAPEMRAVETEEALCQAVAAFGLPVMLKVDGTWGGLGVAKVTTEADARSAFRRMSRKLSATRAIKRLVVNRDPFSVVPWLRGARPRVNVQRYVEGRPANCVLACWEGEVLAGIHVEVMRAQHAMGAATVVRVIEHEGMAEAARRVVRRLGLSGICGLDFILDAASGAAHLIEMNARTTPLGHLALGPGRDPVAALAACASGASVVTAAPVTANDTIAFFPQAWLLEAASPLLESSYHDVPWREPALLRELMRLPWPERSLLARLSNGLRRRVAMQTIDLRTVSRFQEARHEAPASRAPTGEESMPERALADASLP